MLEYAHSVIGAAKLRAGFVRRRVWTGVDDEDVKRIVRANLGKARLAKHGDNVRCVLALL